MGVPSGTPACCFIIIVVVVGSERVSEWKWREVLKGAGGRSSAVREAQNRIEKNRTEGRNESGCIVFVDPEWRGTDLGAGLIGSTLLHIGYSSDLESTTSTSNAASGRNLLHGIGESNTVDLRGLHCSGEMSR